MAIPAIAPPVRLEDEEVFAGEASNTDCEVDAVAIESVLDPGFRLVVAVTVIIASGEVGGAWLGAAAMEPTVMLFTYPVNANVPVAAQYMMY